MATSAGDPAGPARRRVASGLMLLAMMVGLVLAALILSRVAGPLYGLLFSPGAPVPAGAEEIEHAKPDKGAEYWIYRTRLTGHEVTAFYEAEGGSCQYSAQQPQPDEPDPRAVGVSYSVAVCRVQSELGGLGTTWDISIAEGYSEDEGPTVFRIYAFSEVD